MKNTQILALPFLLTIILLSCRKDKPEPETGNIELTINYSVDETSFLFDTLRFTNQSGNEYSVSKLVYYISGVTFIRSDNSTFKKDTTWYIDARNASTNILSVSGVPNGHYMWVSLNIGVDASSNVSGKLPNTLENINMEWPLSMGGGYHFMKLEGYFKDGTTTPGYAMHLGKNIHLVQHDKIDLHLDVHGDSKQAALNMNLNEWFKNPSDYDFNTDGNYSMTSDTAMAKLTANGVDVFSK